MGQDMGLINAYVARLRDGDRDRLSDLVGWTLMIALGVAFVACLVVKVAHAIERDKAGLAMVQAYKIKHACVQVARPVQNQPQLVRCNNGQTTEHLLRKKVVGNAWQ